MENWNRDDYQGRRKDQVEGNGQIMTITLIVAGFCLLVGLIIKFIF